MVQRQRSDPGGAVVHRAAEDPDASVLMVKSEDGPLEVEIVVDPIDTRHVVDEIRENTSSPRDLQKESVADVIDLTVRQETSETPISTVGIPRASWFDVFDWKGTEQASQTKAADANIRDDTDVNERASAEKEVEEPPPPSSDQNGIEVLSSIPSAAVPDAGQAADARPVSPRPDRSVGRRVRDVIKSKTVVTSRDVLASRFERSMARSPRAMKKEKATEMGKAVVQARDVAVASVERFTRPSSVALSKLFQRESIAAPPKLVSEEFTSASVVSASDLKDKPYARTPNAPRLLSEEFTADSIISTSELQSMYFDPPGKKHTARATRQVDIAPTAVPNKEASLMDDLYSTWSDRAEANSPDEAARKMDPEPAKEVFDVPIPLTAAEDDDDEFVELCPPVTISPAPIQVDTSSEAKRELPDTSDEILESTNDLAPEAWSCLGLDDKDFRPCFNAEIPNPCQSKDVSHQSTDTTAPQPFTWCGKSDKEMEITDLTNADANIPSEGAKDHNPSKGVDSTQEGADDTSPQALWCGKNDGNTEDKSASCTDASNTTQNNNSDQAADSHPFSWFSTYDEKVEESSVTNDQGAVDTLPPSCTALSPRNMLESFFACIDPTYEADKLQLAESEKNSIAPLDVRESPEVPNSSAHVATAADICTNSESPFTTSESAPAIIPSVCAQTGPTAVTSSREGLSPINTMSSPSATVSPRAATESSFQFPTSSSSPATSLSPAASPLSSIQPTAGVLSKNKPLSSPVASSLAVSAGLAVAASLANGLSPLFVPNASSSPMPSPTLVSPRETISSYGAAKDEDSVGCNLLDNDLDSVPSVTEDVEDSVAPMQADDLGPPSRPNMNSATLVESKVKKMKLPAEKMAANLDEASTTSTTLGLSGKPKIDPSLDARRRLLIKELRSNIATFGRYDVRCANISAALGDLLEEAKDYDHAVKLHKDAVTIYSCKLGDDHDTTMDARVRLGALLENAGEVEEAINNYYQVTVMRRALNGDQDPSVGDGLVHMANALRKKGDYDQAIKELKRALKVFRESLGDSHTKVATTVDEIASLYVTIGNFDKSAAILEEVVKLKAATMGVKSKAVAGTLGQLATAYECSEKFTEAMKALKKSYKIYTEIGGYSNEDATTTLSRMAQLYEATNDHNRAAVAYLGVLRGRKIQRGADHLSVGETYFRLGRALRETKQFDKALKCHKEALPIFVGQGVEMNDVKMVAEIMHEMALISQDRGHFEDAIRIFKQELSVRRKIGQPEFPFATRALKHLGINEYSLNNYNRALKHLVEALTIYKEHGDHGVECGEILYYTGLVFRKVGNADRALDAFVEAKRIFKDHNVGDSDPLLRGANEHIESIESGTK